MIDKVERMYLKDMHSETYAISLEQQDFINKVVL